MLAVANVGSGVQLEETLNQAGFKATWNEAVANGPTTSCACDVAILDADHLGPKLPSVAELWRNLPDVPGVIAVGNTPSARELAPKARITLLATTASRATLIAAIKEAGKFRLASSMRWPVMRAALGMPPTENTSDAWPTTILQARTVDIDVARAALRWHVQHYATPTPLFDQLREERVLSVPELETIAHADGTKTVQTVVKAGPLNPQQAARLLWTLTSLGAIHLGQEVHNVATPARRSLDEIRKHLRARASRLERSTYFDVLEITPLAEYPEIETAYRLIGSRYSPQAMARYDLADLAPLVAPTWELVEKARTVLVDDAQRGRYSDYLRSHLHEMKTAWAIDNAAAQTAAEAFTRGQAALGEGDAHKAMGQFAAACRNHPNHPDYEATLAWVRFRVQVASGRDQRETAVVERATVEDQLVGRRPWPRALVALALLCAAAGDPDSARWHLAIALSIDPNAPAAVQLAQRLGLRR